MRTLIPSLVIFLAVILAGCANTNGGHGEKTVNVAAPVLTPFEKERIAEINLAEQTRSDFVGAFHDSKAAAQIESSPVLLSEITHTDKQNGQTRQLPVFDSLTFTLPLALKKNPDYSQAIAKIKALAEKLADERGSAEIQFFLLPADAKANKIKFESDSAKSSNGNPITVTKSPDKTIGKGMQRLTVKAAPLQGGSP